MIQTRRVIWDFLFDSTIDSRISQLEFAMRRQVLKLAASVCCALSLTAMTLAVISSGAANAEAYGLRCGPYVNGSCTQPENCHVFTCCYTQIIVYGCFCACW